MARLIRKRSGKIGLPPGTLVHIGERSVAEPVITVMDYDEADCRKFQARSIEQVQGLSGSETITWVNVDGVHDTDLVQKIGQSFGIHALALEDVVNTGQRPKLDDYETHLFLVLKMLYYDEKSRQIVAEQVSFAFGEGFVVSFQEAPGSG